MKKLILTIFAVISLTACKKSEINSSSETLDSLNVKTDSSPPNNVSVYDSIQKPLDKTQDSVKSIIKDTVVVKIQDLKDQKKLLTEKVAKAMDSVTKKEIISEIKITQQKIDSVKNRLVSNLKKRKISPKVIEKTKVVYRNYSKTNNEVLPKITKKGELEIQVDDFETAQYDAKEQIRKYDGVVKGEQISSNENKQFDYLQVSVPLDKSDYLIKDMELNVGKITSRNIEITGQDFSKNSVCLLEITLVNNSEKAIVSSGKKSFGGRSLGAVGSGWNVIQEIFLFVLPFWPVILIGGGIYYHFKKKKSENSNQNI
ncbi:DUF4349 domain-containing protein [Halpernia frigidisoli]|uniref:DUF4349 domain-containing protein n=1 Tax=Halpernia frigidisoli TaxID=1125876 RepID=A0A1I3GX04_9FLAO|nr:DUF4349 domain-containing protein [Halpernia frigidisoli]SFI27929.1 protein of unknown function [Halpernia frigidisoli]